MDLNNEQMNDKEKKEVVDADLCNFVMMELITRASIYNEIENNADLLHTVWGSTSFVHISQQERRFYIKIKN